MPVTSQWFQASGWDSSLPRHFKENNVLFFPVVSDYFDIDIFKEKKKAYLQRFTDDCPPPIKVSLNTHGFLTDTV